MQFEFYENKEKFLSTLQSKIKECSNDFIYECPDEHHINIGFQRLGHSGGRWLIAEIICKNNHTILNGSFKDIYLSSKKNLKNRILEIISNILIYIIIYLFLPGVFYMLWLMTELNYIILFIAPIIIILILRLNGIYENHRIDKKFINFMINEMSCKYTK